MRVTGGESKGRRLKAPRNIRPTQGIVKEAIFNIVAPYIEGATVIDLFAGSGAIGIEALSRGAAHVTFVDREERGLAILRQNLDTLGLKQRARVIRADVARWIEASPDEMQAADLIILDPPYAGRPSTDPSRRRQSSPSTRAGSSCRQWAGCRWIASVATATRCWRSCAREREDRGLPRQLRPFHERPP